MEKHQIVIHGSKVLVIEKEVVADIPLSDFIKTVSERNFVFETKQLPVNCIKYETNENFDRYYIHIPEDNYRFNYNGHLFVVRMPHSLFIFKFRKNKMELLSEPIMLWTDDREVDLGSDHFFVPLLHNVYDSGKICAGTRVRKANDQRQYVNEYLTNFFTTEFNDDINDNKRLMSSVSKDQLDYNKHTSDSHELVELWWKRLIHEHDVYVLSKQMFNIQRGRILQWVK